MNAVPLGREHRHARMLLTTWSEPGDDDLAAHVEAVGAARAVDEILTDTSPLRRAAGLRTRIRDGLRSVDALVAPIEEQADRCGARFIMPGDAEWPTQLDDLLTRAPLGLWLAGAADLRRLAAFSLAMVGARASTPYGEGVAREMAADLAVAQWAVVSGGAFGIDAAAHRGALDARGATVCVLAGGVDVPYPRAHESLIARIREQGLLVSETPLGGAPMRQRFLTRNRVIAALARGTVVVEAALRSGSGTTAREAHALGRAVMAVPGPVSSPQSAGCHALIRDIHAHLVTGSRDVLRHVDPMAVEPDDDWRDDILGQREARVLDAVPLRRPAPVSRISSTAGLVEADVLAALGVLEAEGFVERAPSGWRRGSAPREPSPRTMDG